MVVVQSMYCCAQAMAPAAYAPIMGPASALPVGTTSLLDTHVLSGSALRNRGVAAAESAPAGGPSQSLRLVSGITYAGEHCAGRFMRWHNLLMAQHACWQHGARFGFQGLQCLLLHQRPELLAPQCAVVLGASAQYSSTQFMPYQFMGAAQHRPPHQCLALYPRPARGL